MKYPKYFTNVTNILRTLRTKVISQIYVETIKLDIFEQKQKRLKYFISKASQKGEMIYPQIFKCLYCDI